MRFNVRCGQAVCGLRDQGVHRRYAGRGNSGEGVSNPHWYVRSPAHHERAPLAPLVPTTLVLCTRAPLTPRVLVPGDRGTSARCVLSNQEQIERDSAEEFVVTVDSDIGEIQRLRIGHDESNLGELSLCPLRSLRVAVPPSCSPAPALCCSLLLSAARACRRIGLAPRARRGALLVHEARVWIRGRRGRSWQSFAFWVLQMAGHVRFRWCERPC